MKQILRYKNNANIPMMTALGEQVTNVFRIHLVQQIVENYETVYRARCRNSGERPREN